MKSEEKVIPFRETRRHWFTDAQKWALLLEYDQCLERGSKSAFCRRLAIDTVTMRKWSRMRAQGLLLAPATVGDMTEPVNPSKRLGYQERQEFERLRRENQRLQDKLDQSEAAVEVLGKAAALLEALAKSAQHNQADPEPEPETGLPEWLQGSDTSRLPQIPPKNS